MKIQLIAKRPFEHEGKRYEAGAKLGYIDCDLPMFLLADYFRGSWIGEVPPEDQQASQEAIAATPPAGVPVADAVASDKLGVVTPPPAATPAATAPVPEPAPTSVPSFTPTPVASKGEAPKAAEAQPVDVKLDETSAPETKEPEAKEPETNTDETKTDATKPADTKVEDVKPAAKKGRPTVPTIGK